MFGLSIEQALTLAEEFFPNAPEKIVEQHNIDVRRSRLNCDGWCLELKNRAIIRINSASPKARQRFTLAHELGHLILGIPAVVGEDVFSKPNSTEREVDELAAKILLPASKVRNEIQEVPITRDVIKRIAKRAKVSDVVVALRLAHDASDFGLTNASVVFYSDDKMVWQFSESLRLTKPIAGEVLAECKEASGLAARIPHKQNQLLLASLLDNPTRNTKTVFVQLVPDHEGIKKLRVERLRELESELFRGDVTFRACVNGRLGTFKSQAMKLHLTEAVHEFLTRWIDRQPHMLTRDQVELMLSNKGAEYIRLKLKQWTMK